MVRQFVLLVVLLWCCTSAFTQIVWQKHFHDVSMDVISMMHLKKTNTIRMVGVQNDQPLSYLFNKDKKLTSSSIFPKELPFTPDIIYGLDAKHYIITKTGERGLTYAKVDLKGKVIWKKAFPSTAKITTMSTTQTGGFLMVGTRKGQMYAARIDAKGRVIWQETFGGSGKIFDVVEMKDGSFILAGYIDLFQSGETDYFITKFDANGKNLWEKVLGDPEYLNEKARLLAITPQQQIVVIGNRDNNLWMLQMSPDKQTITWEKEYNKKGYQLEPTRLSMLDNGNIFISNRAKKEEASHLFMVQLNTELMASSNDLAAKFFLEPTSSYDQRRLDVRFKPINKYYRVTTDLNNVDQLQLYGKYKKGYSIYVLGINRKGMIGVVYKPKTKAIQQEMIANVDLAMYQYLIVLVSDSPCDIQKIRDELAKNKRVISALPRVLNNRLIPYDNVYYNSNELSAYARFGMQNIVSFFIQLK